SISGINISGPDASNYTLASSTASASANITVRTLTVTAAGQDKVYDGSTVATATLSDDRVPGDSLVVSDAAAEFSDKNASPDKSISISGISISGPDAENYTLAFTTASPSTNIIVHTLTVTATGDDKVYDGTTTATATLSDDRVSGDSLTVTDGSALFADKN